MLGADGNLDAARPQGPLQQIQQRALVFQGAEQFLAACQGR